MIQTLLTLSTLFCLSCSNPSPVRIGRDSFATSYSYAQRGPEYMYEPLKLPLQESQLYSLGIESFLPFPADNSLSASKANIAPVALSNSVEKPVQERSDAVPPLPAGTAIIPLQPPPAVPVNAAAANVPSNNGAVFLGSGALGVINLGNGAFALGSGGIGYSNMRQQPRPNGKSPLYPPLPANPNLVPAATPSQPSVSVPQLDLSGQLSPDGFQFSQPLFTPVSQQKQVDQNGYERLQPNSVGFGVPTARLRPLKTRVNYATLTAPQITAQVVHPSQLPQPGFGTPIPRLLPQALKYVV